MIGAGARRHGEGAVVVEAPEGESRGPWGPWGGSSLAEDVVDKARKHPGRVE